MTDYPLIDFHAHPSTHEHIVDSGGPFYAEMSRYFRRELRPESVDAMVEKYRDAGVSHAVIFAWDAETATGLPPTTNEYIADIVSRYDDFFIGFASVDPWKGKRAIFDLEHAIVDLGLRGLKLHPIAQEFFPSEPRFRPLFAKCQELQIPVVLHMGTTGWGAGMPGGGGVRLKYGHPIPYLDDVAADFPGLTLIGAHPAFPWVEELLAIATHKPNVYFDLSGWRPKYFPEIVVKQAGTILADKALFGTDYPLIDPGTWLADFRNLGFSEEVSRKILSENARRILKL